MDYWFTQGLWIAKRVFSTSDYEALKDLIRNRQYQRYDDEGRVIIVFKRNIDYKLTVQQLGQDVINVEIGYAIN